MCSEAKQKTRIFVATNCFGKMVLFCAHTKSPNTTKIGVSASTQGKTQNGKFGLSPILGRGLERGFYYLWSLKDVFAENAIFIVFSAKHSFADMKECNLKKITKIGGCLPKCKKVFFWYVFGFWVVLFFFSVFLCFCFEKGPKRLFSCNFRVFLFYSVPPTGLSLKSVFFSSYSVFLFFLSSLVKIHFSFPFCPSTPFWEHSYLGFLLFFFLLPFPFLMFACFFETNFPNIPFWKPKLLSFLAVSLSYVVFVFVFMVYGSAFLFLCWFCFG